MLLTNQILNTYFSKQEVGKKTNESMFYPAQPHLLNKRKVN